MRTILLTAFASLALCSTSMASREHAAEKGGRPHVLFIIADDIGKEMFGAYGNTFIKTPNFDKLASSGVKFTNAFTTNGKCSPSRASILTGRHFFQLEDGACHGRTFPTAYSTYPDILARNGYHTGFTGKGWSPGKWNVGGRKVPPSGKQYSSVKYAPDHHVRVGFRNFKAPDDYSNIKVRALGPHSAEKMRELIFTGNVWNVDYNGNFDQFLKEKKKGDPFCFWFGSHDAHGPWLKGSGTKYKGNLDEVTVPPYYPDTQVVREYLLDFAVEVELFDAQIGEAIASLKKHNLYDNTIIVITSDNGTAGLRNKGDTYPVNMNMPLIVHYPKKMKPGVNDERVNFSDFAPTFLDLAGVKIPDTMTGKSFKALITGGRYHGDSVMFGGRETYGTEFVYPARMIWKDGFYYIRNYYHDRRYPSGRSTVRDKYNSTSLSGQITDRKLYHDDDSFWRWNLAKRPAEELYNLAEDPFCLNNLAADKAHLRQKEKLAADLQQRLRQDADPRTLGKSSAIKKWDHEN